MDHPSPDRRRLEEALRERDQALEALALVRAELDGLRLLLSRKGEPAPPLYPSTAAPSLAPPLRYLVVDELNSGLKWALGPVHRGVRRLLGGRRA
jgi:hypothetical protein